MKLMKTALIATVSLLWAGCGSTTKLVIRNIEARPSPPPAAFMAGTAKVDITPRPGISKAGYSTWSKDGTGFRNRLYARVFYFRDTDGRAMAIVQADLHAGSLPLQRRIAEMVAGETDLDAGNIMLTATHTHQGPGQYYGNDFYNRFASNRSGFSKEVFDFLAERIALGVLEAYGACRPAGIAAGTIKVWGAARNRSMEPYVANETVEDKSLEPGQELRAVNPVLHMVRIDALSEEGRPTPLGAFSSFSVHGTVLPADNRFYDAEIWASIAREVEWRIADRYDPPRPAIHGPFVRTHGDTNPNIAYGMEGYIESCRIGEEIGLKAWELFEHLGEEIDGNAVVRTAAREVDMLDAPEIEGICIAGRAAAGTALTGGATENLSPLIGHIPPFKKGCPRRVFTRGEQGHKRLLGGVFQYLVLPRESFPRKLLVQTFQVGDSVIVALPFEITTEAGHRIESGVRLALQDAGLEAGHVVVSSVANGYFGYTTTREEYARQWYEGGHTLYGPNTTAYLTAHAAQVAGAMARQDRVADYPAESIFTLKSAGNSKPDLEALGLRATNRRPQYSPQRVNEEDSWSFRWYDIPPGRIAWDRTLVGVEVRTDDGDWVPLRVGLQPIDDSGSDISVRFLGEINDDNMGLYETCWYNPVPGGEDRRYRFTIAPRPGQDRLCSEPFH